MSEASGVSARLSWFLDERVEFEDPLSAENLTGRIVSVWVHDGNLWAAVVVHKSKESRACYQVQVTELLLR
jgi:head-tail adaptor